MYDSSEPAVGCFRHSFHRIVHEEDGGTLVEYVLLVAMIGVLAIVAMQFLGNVASARLNNVGTVIS